MDKIKVGDKLLKVGDKLRKGDTIITIAEVYLFQMAKGDNFERCVVYDWHNTKTNRIENGVASFNLNWEGWEKV